MSEGPLKLLDHYKKECIKERFDFNMPDFKIFLYNLNEEDYKNFMEVFDTKYAERHTRTSHWIICKQIRDSYNEFQKDITNQDLNPIDTFFITFIRGLSYDKYTEFMKIFDYYSELKDKINWIRYD